MSAHEQVCEADMDPEAYASLWVGRAKNLVIQLREEREKHLRQVIALVRAAGGEIRIDPMDLHSRDYDLHQWNDNSTGEMIFRTPKGRK